MKTFIKKYNLEVLTVLMFMMVTFTAVWVPNVSITQKILVVYMFLFTLHEWEENRYPGGFSNIMEGMIGKKFSEDAKEMSHVPVLILLLAIHVIPYIFDEVIFLVLIPIFLGVFEGFVHTMGVKLSKAEKFYTPGMVTAYCLFAFSVYCIYYMANHNMAAGKDFVIGFVCMFASFAIMQNRVLAINGVKYRDILSVIKSRKKASE